jgi:hypothetical protein
VASESRPVKATSTAVGEAIADAVVRGTEVLRRRLEEEGVARALPKRFDSDGCRLECLLFEWFLADVTVAAQFGRHAAAIRRVLRRRLLTVMDGGDLTPAVLVNFEQTQRERFAEYAEAFRSSSSLQRLGAVAWLRIQGSDESSDRMTMLLAVWATAELRALQGLAARYVVRAGWGAWQRRRAGGQPEARPPLSSGATPAWEPGSPAPLRARSGYRRRALAAVGAAIGLGLFVVGVGIFAHQVGTWLDTLRWEKYSLLDLLASPAVRPALPRSLVAWLSRPESWYGLHTVLTSALESTPAALALVLGGAFATWWALRD